MKRSIGLWQLMGFSVTSLGGTLLHFLYEWSGDAILVAPFSGVNESTWEHMKLLFWPMLVFGIVQSFFLRNLEDFWCVKLRGMLLGLSLIPLIFCTYNGVIGKSPDWVNIAIFFISALFAYAYEAMLLSRRSIPCKSPRMALGIMLILATFFVIFTFKAPEIEIFRDPISGAFGIAV